MVNYLFTDRGRLELGPLVATMRKLGIRRLVVADKEIELGPEPAAVQAKEDLAAIKDEFVCPCGHHVVTDHNETGCLHGCAHEVCASKDGEEPAQ